MSDHNEKTARPLRRWLVDLGLILAAFIAIHWWQTKPLPTGPAPELKAELISGQPVDLADYKGKTVLVHFWADWCPICKAEQDNIQSISEDFPVLTVAMQSGNAGSVREFMQQESLTFPAVADPLGVISSGWGVQAVPVSFIIDAAGDIRFTEVGLTTEAGLRVRLWAAEKL